MTEDEKAAEQERNAALEASERLAREADRAFARRHRDGDPPPAAKG